MNEHLIEIRDSIHNLLLYNEANAKSYIQLVTKAIKTLEAIEAKPNSTLDNYRVQALTDLSNELANRVNANFFKSDPERQKAEFKFSRSIALLAISNVLSVEDIQ